MEQFLFDAGWADQDCSTLKTDHRSSNEGIKNTEWQRGGR